MSTDAEREPPPYYYIVPDEGQSDGHIYHNTIPSNSQESASNATPGSDLESGGGKSRCENYDMELGSSPGMTTCTSCQQQVMTNVTYKAGRFAWQMFLLIFILGLFTCGAPFILLPLPLCLKKCKDVHHSCPLCNKVLHVDKRKFCEGRT